MLLKFRVSLPKSTNLIQKKKSLPLSGLEEDTCFHGDAKSHRADKQDYLFITRVRTPSPFGVYVE